MGTDKTQLKLGDRTLLQHACGAFARQGIRVWVVGRTEQRGDFEALDWSDLPTRPLFTADRHAGRGPLEALATGLESVRDWGGSPAAQFAFVSTCDAPGLRPELFQQLLARIDNDDAVFPYDAHHRYGLTAVYRVAAAAKIRELADRGLRRIIDLPDHLAIRLVEMSDCRQADPDLASFRNINTPDEFQQLSAVWPTAAN